MVLATGIIEKLYACFPDAQIDFLVRKGNESLLKGHPFLHEVLVWDKKKNKLRNLWDLLQRIRRAKYDKVINVQRFAATGLLTAFSGAAETIGFDKNPISRLFTKRIRHIVSESRLSEPGMSGEPGHKHVDTGHIFSEPDISGGLIAGHMAGESSSGEPVLSQGRAVTHEIDRNQELIKDFTDPIPAKPRLYPSQKDYEHVREYKGSPYITISPASVWFTKQYPKDKWISFINQVPTGYTIYLLGAPSDRDLCENIRKASDRSLRDTAIHQSGERTIQDASDRPRRPSQDTAIHQSGDRIVQDASDRIDRASAGSIVNLSGKLEFLQSVALMKDATMNYVNDSAPMHFASAANAPVTAIYCSTIPAFGFGPLSDIKFIVEIKEPLDCRPCGLHGYKACPRGHFNCAYKIADEQLLETLDRAPAPPY